MGKERAVAFALFVQGHEALPVGLDGELGHDPRDEPKEVNHRANVAKSDAEPFVTTIVDDDRYGPSEPDQGSPATYDTGTALLDS
jgi:hypothetical protein